MANPSNLLYTKSHEWVQEMGDGSYRVGLTDYAQDQLGDLVFVNLPQEGDSVEVGAASATSNRSKLSPTSTARSPAPSAPSTRSCWTTRS